MTYTIVSQSPGPNGGAIFTFHPSGDVLKVNEPDGVHIPEGTVMTFAFSFGHAQIHHFKAKCFSATVSQRYDQWHEMPSIVDELFVGLDGRRYSTEVLEDCRHHIHSVELENDGLRISLIVQINFKAVETGATLSEKRDDSLWEAYELEVLQYDNENGIDRAFIKQDASEADVLVRQMVDWWKSRVVEFGK